MQQGSEDRDYIIGSCSTARFSMGKVWLSGGCNARWYAGQEFALAGLALATFERRPPHICRKILVPLSKKKDHRGLLRLPDKVIDLF